MKEQEFMLDIERRIYFDSNGSFRRATMARLLAIQQRLRGGLRAQHTPAANREMNAALRAVEAAVALMQRYGA
jgi:hypothetical protein